jgi:hypothetical protein
LRIPAISSIKPQLGMDPASIPGTGAMTMTLLRPARGLA